MRLTHTYTHKHAYSNPYGKKTLKTRFIEYHEAFKTNTAWKCPRSFSGPYSVRMRGNTDQKNSENGQFSRSATPFYFLKKKLNNLSLYILPCSFPIFSPSKEMTKLWVGVFVQTTLCCYTEVAPGVVAATETQLSDGTTAWFETLKVKQKNDIICLKMLLCKILIYNLKLKQMVKLVETLTSSGFSAVIRAAITWPFGFIDS